MMQEQANPHNPLRKRLLLAIYNAEDKLGADNIEASINELEPLIDEVIDINPETASATNPELHKLLFRLYALRVESEHEVMNRTDDEDKIQSAITRLTYYAEKALAAAPTRIGGWNYLLQALESYEQLWQGLADTLELVEEDSNFLQSTALVQQIGNDIPDLVNSYANSYESLSSADIESEHMADRLKYLTAYLESVADILATTQATIPDELSIQVPELSTGLNHSVEHILQLMISLTARMNDYTRVGGGTTGRLSAAGLITLLYERTRLMEYQFQMGPDRSSPDSYLVTSEDIVADCEAALAEDREWRFLSPAQKMDIYYSMGISLIFQQELNEAHKWFRKCLELYDPQDREVRQDMIAEVRRLIKVCNVNGDEES